MYKSSSAWSFKGRYKAKKLSQTPCPATYSPQTWKTLRSPTWIIGKEIRTTHKNQGNPGPAHYDTAYCTKNKKFGKFGLEKYHYLKANNNNPDPSQYQPNYSYQKRLSPSHSFCQNEKPFQKLDVPGPGTYTHTHNNLKKGIKITRERRFQTEKDKNPGPGAYQSSRGPFGSISVSFTKDSKAKRSTIHNPGRTQFSHSAGQYEQMNCFDENLKTNKGFTMKNKNKSQKISVSPGPADYDPIISRSSTQQCLITKMTQNSCIVQTPGPSEYDPKNNFKNSNGVIIGKAHRNFQIENEWCPGPGTYENEKIHKQNPMYSIPNCGRRDGKKTVPGPGKYTPVTSQTKKRPQSAKIGNQKRVVFKTEVTPGPGNYNVSQRPASPKHSFSRSKKYKNCRQTTPGPGDYKIDSLIGNISSYVLR